ncbi:MAG: lipoyl protein ligase domain-containing protein [Ilumatobacteraceae bacterium]
MTHADETLSWRLSSVRGTAAELHGLNVRDLTGDDRSITLCEVSRPAIVLGSTQHDDDVDAHRAADLGVDVVRRRSGGGAVWLHPADSIWIDLWIPRGDRLWTDDVSGSMIFAGEAFVAALDTVPRLAVWRNRFDAGEFGRRVCFASDAPGEVRGPEGKAVGISQRRDRSGARLQCVLYRRWSPTEWSSVFVDDDVCRAVEMLTVTTVDIGTDVLVERLAAALTPR